jgi:[acyl-carrier-protein] S-malonyltransferase
MRPAGEKLKSFLEKISFSIPGISLINNVDVKTESDPARIKDALVRQAYSPVRWVEVVKNMVDSGATHVIECGPGRVLAGLTKRIDAKVRSLSLADRAALEQALQEVKGG